MAFPFRIFGECVYSRCRVVCTLLLIAHAALIGGCRKKEEAVKAAKPLGAEVAVSAAVMTIEPQPWPAIVRTQGNLIADDMAVVGAKVAGRVAQTVVELGQEVHEGDPLVRLDPVEFEMQVTQADAQLLQSRSAVGLKPGDPLEKLEPLNAPPVREARAVWDEAKARRTRYDQLRAQNAAAAEEYEQILSAERVAEARHASALNSVYEKIALIKVRMAELNLAQDRLRETVIIAPFDGIVQQRFVAVGAYVQVGQQLATVVRTNPLRFQGMVPERAAQALSVGQELKLEIEAVKEPRKAYVTRISPTIESRSRALLFEAVIDNSDGSLRAGLFAEAEVLLDESALAVVIPASALVEFAGAEKVWKVVEGKGREQQVRTGRRTDQLIEITRGLQRGDVILIDGKLGRPAPIMPVAEIPTTNAAALFSTDHNASGREGSDRQAAPVDPARSDLKAPTRSGT